jgi:phage tail-like protein
MSEVTCERIETKERWAQGIEGTKGEKPFPLESQPPVNLDLSDACLTLKQGSRKAIYYLEVPSDKYIGTSWRRVKFEADTPGTSKIVVAYATAENEITDPRDPAQRWSDKIVNPKEIILKAPRGKYFWLRIKLLADINTGKAPALRSIQIYFSTTTYFDYLPAIYQENSLSRTFLEKFLAVFETRQAELDNTIVNTPRLFDAKKTPDSFLPWLSTWVGASMDENWPESKWRTFLSRAVRLYRMRGTKRELADIIEIYTGEAPYAIIERALLKTDDADYENLLNQLFGNSEYSFRVLLNPGQIKNEVEARTVTRIIEAEKPAHTQGCFIMLGREVLLDWHTYLGVNSYVVEPAQEMVVGKAKASVNTVVVNPPSGG